MISENFEITRLKWLKQHTCAPIKPSVTRENFIFFLIFNFVSGNLALKSKEVKCYQKWLKMFKKMVLNQNFTVLFNPNFNDKFI